MSYTYKRTASPQTTWGKVVAKWLETFAIPRIMTVLPKKLGATGVAYSPGDKREFKMSLPAKSGAILDIYVTGRVELHGKNIVNVQYAASNNNRVELIASHTMGPGETVDFSMNWAADRIRKFLDRR